MVKYTVINSRLQAFWFEAVMLVDNEIVKSLGHEKTEELAKDCIKWELMRVYFIDTLKEA